MESASSVPDRSGANDASSDARNTYADGVNPPQSQNERQNDDSHTPESHTPESSAAPESSANDGMAVSSILYVMDAYNATAKPVTITMILSALAANFIRTEASAKAQEKALTNSYSAIKVQDGTSASKKFGLSLVNGLVIIGVITLVTFLVVLLYKYRCMRILKGYLALSITFLLGFFGTAVFHEAINRYDFWVSKVTFGLAVYNYTIVGIYTLFYGKGVPVYVGQAYLVLCSVLLAWQLSYFSEIMAWILLVLLAFYDLYAVLTPCGPLRALVNLMGREGAQQLPALLYEAQLPTGSRRQSAGSRRQSSTAERRPIPPSQQTEQHTSSNDLPADRQSLATNGDGVDIAIAALPSNEAGTVRDGSPVLALTPDTNTTSEEEEKKDDRMEMEESTHDMRGPRDLMQLNPVASPLQMNNADRASASATSILVQSPTEVVLSGENDEYETVPRPTGTIPLAIAILYKLPLVNGTSTEGEFTPEQLKAMVDVYYPRNGGHMECLPNPADTNNDSNNPHQWWNRTGRDEFEPTKYRVIDRHGNVRRIIFVDNDGKVMRLLDEREQEEEERSNSGSVKLGLGDFIFYSVLVSKASLYSFPTFMACVVGILEGLLLTLVLLAIRGKALPALPISIFFGVAFYLPTRYVLLEFIHEMYRDQLYL